MQKIADYLLLHNHTRDNALGLIYPGRVTIQLAYHVQREQEAQNLKDFNDGFIAGCKARIKQIKLELKQNNNPALKQELEILRGNIKRVQNG